MGYNPCANKDSRVSSIKQSFYLDGTNVFSCVLQALTGFALNLLVLFNRTNSSLLFPLRPAH